MRKDHAMLKSEILAALEKIHGDPEIEVRATGLLERKCPECGEVLFNNMEYFILDRINEYPRPEIVVIEK